MRQDRMLPALALVAALAVSLVPPAAVRADPTPTSAATPNVTVYADSVSDLAVTTELRADLGPTRFGGLALASGAVVRLEARFARPPGGTSPVLTSLTIDGKGVKSGPASVKHLSVARDGTFAIDLDPLLPLLHITKVEPRPDGAVRLDIAGWWTPDAIVTRTGEVKIAGLTVARLGFSPFARSWPLRLEDLVAIVESGDGGPSPLSTLRGSLTWDVKVAADGASIPVKGARVSGAANAETCGAGVLENGRLTGSAEGKVAADLPNLGGLKIGTDAASISLECGTASLAGRFKLDLPLDPHAIAELARKGLSTSVAGTARPSTPTPGLGRALAGPGR